jgi:hypothetical protein
MNADECFTCTEPGSGVEGECPMSERRCGHHCNHIWDQDICHWCNAEISDDGDLIPNYAPLELAGGPVRDTTAPASASVCPVAPLGPSESTNTAKEP